MGDGWYSDGPSFSMDYYNDYVIHPMLVDIYQVLKEKKIVSERQYNTAVKRMIRHSDFSERMIMPDGVFPAFGRSATYRTGAFQSLSQVALMKILPSYIHPAQVRCALTAVFVNMYDGNQNFDKNGWLVLGFNGHQPELADYYTTTGSLYMATLGFLALGLIVLKNGLLARSGAVNQAEKTIKLSIEVIYKTEKKLSFHYLIFNLKFKLYETENIYFK